jgi:hypothetical protein
VLPASTLRGGIGYALKRILCHYSIEQNCSHCEAFLNCDYPRLFEPMGDICAEDMYVGYVRPFVISTHLHSNDVLTKDDVYRFRIRVFGKSISYVPYLITSVLELSKKGIGKGKQTFIVESVESFNEIGMPKLVFSNEHGVLSEPWIISGKRIKSIIHAYKDCREIEVRFQTPCKIQIKGQLQSDLSFPLFIQNVMRRIQAVLAHHQNILIRRKQIDELVEMAKDVKTKDCSLNWFSNRRFSTRQQKLVSLSGFIGNVRYEGNLALFLDLIYLGTYLHLGKQTAFGLGKYECVIL